MTTAVLDHVADELVAALPDARLDAVERDVPSADLVTSRVGGPIAVLVRGRTAADVGVVAEVVRRHRVPVAVIGRGSNLLVADRGFEGVVVVLSGEFDELEINRGRVVAGGAVALPVLARRTAAAGCRGLEFYVGIPGSVGGAVRMNAGGHGRETVDVLRRAWLIDLLAGGSPVEVPVANLELGYRRSNLTDTTVVLRAEFAVDADDPSVCEQRIDEIVRWRREHQPGGANAGSVFTNPPDDSAGRLIDECGLKGLRVGGAEVSAKHANFIQADSTATAADIVALIAEIRGRVAAATGTVLVPELRMLGFDGPNFEDLGVAGLGDGTINAGEEYA